MIYAISDVHLPLGVDKPMDVFGKSWENYVYRLEENFFKFVKEDDTVIMPGDISWATYLEQAVADFAFLNRLPGKKVITKGNHDYWWTTASKLNQFLEENRFDKITFVHNNSYMAEGCAICGCRGWITPREKGFSAEDDKIYKREQIRMALSLDHGLAQNPKKLIMAIHYPPYEGFCDVLQRYDVDFCVYGHLHGDAARRAEKPWPRAQVVSCDYLEFSPFCLNNL